MNNELNKANSQLIGRCYYNSNTGKAVYESYTNYYNKK